MLIPLKSLRMIALLGECKWASTKSLIDRRVQVGRTYGFKCSFEFYRFHRTFASFVADLSFFPATHRSLSAAESSLDVKLEPIFIQGLGIK